jgi:hypothetical protein
MNRILSFFTVALMAGSVFAFDHIPQNYEVLTNPAGPAVSATLGAIHLTQVDLKECSSFAKYTGDTTLQLGNQTYKLTHIASTAQDICPGDVNFQKFTQVFFIFQNSEFQNQIRLVLDQDSMPMVSVILDQGHVVPGKALN